MGILIPWKECPMSHWLTIKKQAKAALIRNALRKYPESKPEQWVIRDIYPGDDTSTDFNDFDFKTAQTSTVAVRSIQDAGDLTAHTDSTIFTDGEKMDDDKFMAVVGVADALPRTANLVLLSDVAGEGGGLGETSRIKMERGTDVIALWDPQAMYSYAGPKLAISDEILLWKPKQLVKWSLNCSEATRDKHLKFIGWIAERHGENISPVSPEGRPVGGLVGPAFPVDMWAPEALHAHRKDMADYLRQYMVTKHFAHSKKDVRIHDILWGPSTGGANTVEIRTKNNVVAAHHLSAFDDDSITADLLSEVILASEKVEAEKAYFVYGAASRHLTNDLLAVGLMDGSGGLADIWDLELAGCFRNPSIISERPGFYGSTWAIRLALRAVTKTDKYLTYRIMVADIPGSTSGV